jgi:hypothetical protein
MLFITKMLESGGTILALMGLLLQLTTGSFNVPCVNCKEVLITANPNVVRIDFEGRMEGLRYTGVSQGTIITGNILLTHHHYEIALETLVTLTLTLTDVKGNHQTITVEPKHIVAVDAGTTLIPLPEAISWNPDRLAIQVQHLDIQQGDQLTTYYLNSNGIPTVIELTAYVYDTISYPGLTSLILKDPQAQIKPGDSGGGVFYQGELIGNLWAIGHAEAGGNYVRVALIP